jgi:hypothetical protein
MPYLGVDIVRSCEKPCEKPTLSCDLENYWYATSHVRRPRFGVVRPPKTRGAAHKKRVI